ncbi:MAG: acyl-CoA dehydrogenase family protein [Firmicutes bacterium]|nr:acyl-CoA dehydrogenase family protein [Bacillota bacterium]
MAFHVYTEDQLMGIENAREFAKERILPVLRELDDNGTFPKDIIEAGFEMGFHALDFPEEYGGLGFDAKTACIIFEELAKADSGIACAYSVTGTAIAPIMEYGTHEQKKIVQELVLEKGGLASFCLTEPTSGSDSGSARTRAVREGDEYVINGNKCFITNGAYANLYFVVASTDPSKGNKGLSTFIVPAGTPGLSIGREEIKCGFRTSNTVEVLFDNVRIPASYRVGEEGEGFKITMAGMDHGRPYIGAIALGIGQRALEEAIHYSKSRSQFGRPICDNQGIQFMLADMEIQMEAARCLVYHVADLIDQKLPISQNGSISKCFATDAAMKVTLDAVQIFGGYGYTKNCPVEKLMRDAKLFQIVEGTNQIQRMIISRNLLK